MFLSDGGVLPMASYQNNNNSGDLLSWIVTLVFLVSPAWPIGLILLFRKLMGKSGSSRRTQQIGRAHV